MSKVKRILAIVLAMAMVMAMSVTAFAGSAGTDGKYGTEDDLGTITVSGIKSEDIGSAAAVAYKIIEAKYENGGNFSGYNSLYPTIITTPTGDLTVTEDQLAAVMKAAKVAGTEYSMTKNTGTASFTAEVPVGSYLVVIHNTDKNIYSPVVVSVAYVNENGGNALDEGSVNVIADGESWAKVRENPGLDKKIVGSDKKDKGNTVNLGDTVQYELKTTIPYYGGSYPKFEITDTLTGLTYKDGLTVKVGETVLTKDTHYTVTDSITNEFTINFVVNNAYTLNEYQGQDLIITYNATVNDDATLNQTANTNEATLTYSKDSSVDGSDGTDDAETKTYTFDIDAAVNGSVTEKILTKVGEEVKDGVKQPLEGAEFTLYTDAGCNNKYENSVFKGVVSSDKDGQLPIRGLKAGTYYLKETKAPDNYSLLDTVYTITINAEVSDAGELTSWSIAVNGATISGDDHTATSRFTVNNGTVTEDGIQIEEVQIQNTKLSSLPSTGGAGIIVFTIVGCIIMIAAASMFFLSGRKKEE